MFDHIAACANRSAITSASVLYGADPDVVRQLLVAQDFKCAICGKPIDERADLDHDHATGKIRGLLDRRCNIWLAALEDPAFEANARAYLARFRP